MRTLYPIAAAVRKKFVDTFQRTSTGMGIATDGSKWNTDRGTWNVTPGAAATSTSASSYPMVTQDMPYSNATVSVVSSAQGATAALWVTDANNWWAVGMRQEAVSCNCTNVCSSYGCTGYGCTGYGCTSYSSSCSGYGCTGYGCVFYNRYPPYACGAYGCTGTGCTSYSNTCSGYGCTAYGCTASGCTGYTYSCSTCYPQYIRVLQAVSNTVTEITNWTIANVAAAFKVKTSGSAITIKPYSDAGMTTQIGSDLTYTPSSPTTTKKFGLMISPSAYNQGSTIASTTIETNP